MMARFTVFGFETTHDALAAERALLEAAVPVVAVPTPKTLGALCGIAIRAPLADAERVERALVAAGIRWTRRVEIEDRAPHGLSR